MNGTGKTGFTLIETVIAVAVFAVLVTVVWQILEVVRRGAEKGGDRASVEAAADRAMEKLEKELLDRIIPGFNKDPLVIPKFDGVDWSEREIPGHERKDRTFRHTGGPVEGFDSSGEQLLFSFTTEIPFDSDKPGAEPWEVRGVLRAREGKRSPDLVLTEDPLDGGGTSKRVIARRIFEWTTESVETLQEPGGHLEGLPVSTMVTFTIWFEAPSPTRWPKSWKNMSHEEKKQELRKRGFSRTMRLHLPVRASKIELGGGSP